MKTKIYTLLIIMLLCASCSKDASVDSKIADISNVVYDENTDPNGIFNVSRTGELVTIKWMVDFSDFESIEILRNETGLPKSRTRAAILAPKAKNFQDILPDAKAYWYWIKVATAEGEIANIGPIMADPDLEKAGKYVNIADTHSFVIQRTSSLASVTWKFPDIKYKQIKFRRGQTARANKLTEVIVTQNHNGELSDQLPDPKNDYWYWYEAVLETGAVISQGPFKAQLTSN